MASTMSQDEEARKRHVEYQKLVTYFVRTPVWALSALPKSNRPRPDWSIERVLRRKIVMRNNRIAALAGLKGVGGPNYLALDTSPGVKGLWVKPVPHLIVGDVKKWADAAGVQCARIPGYWIEKGVDRLPGSPPKRGEKVLYHLHGGGYVELSGHPSDDTIHIARGIMEYTPIERTFSLEYRLTRGPPKHVLENPFPAALLDAIAGYDYLVNGVGFAPEDIILEGDSAGGNLAMALVRYLIENADNGSVKLPGVPSALVLCSPWAYMASLDLPKDSPLRKTSSVYYNRRTDFINIAGKTVTNDLKNFCGPLGPAASHTNRYISPCSTSPDRENASFKGYPPTFILSGGAEVMADQLRDLGKRMAEDMGHEKVEFVEYPAALHDFLTFPWHEPERTEALKHIGKWLFPQFVQPRRRWWMPKAKL